MVCNRHRAYTWTMASTMIASLYTAKADNRPTSAPYGTVTRTAYNAPMPRHDYHNRTSTIYTGARRPTYDPTPANLEPAQAVGDLEARVDTPMQDIGDQNGLYEQLLTQTPPYNPMSQEGATLFLDIAPQTSRLALERAMEEFDKCATPRTLNV